MARNDSARLRFRITAVGASGCKPVFRPCFSGWMSGKGRSKCKGAWVYILNDVVQNRMTGARACPQRWLLGMGTAFAHCVQVRLWARGQSARMHGTTYSAMTRKTACQGPRACPQRRLLGVTLVLRTSCRLASWPYVWRRHRRPRHATLRYS